MTVKGVVYSLVRSTRLCFSNYFFVHERWRLSRMKKKIAQRAQWERSLRRISTQTYCNIHRWNGPLVYMYCLEYNDAYITLKLTHQMGACTRCLHWSVCKMTAARHKARFRSFKSFCTVCFMLNWRLGKKYRQFTTTVASMWI